MINQVYSSNPFISISPATSSPHINNNGQCAGQTRWNTSTQNLEVFDGLMWHNMLSNVYIDLSNEVTELLHWVRKKRDEEQQLEKLITQHPGLKEAHERFEIMKKIVQVGQEPV